MSRASMGQRPLGRRIIRRVLFTLGGLLAVFVVLGIIGAIIGAIVGPPPAATRTADAADAAPITAAPAPAAAPTVVTAAPSAAPVATPELVAPVSEPVTVLRVIDGDTFELASGQRVRVLGIDSCEMSTDAGPRAKQAAEAFLYSPQVTLHREPGVDQDRYGRLLRYVSTSYGTDMGETMVSGSHTGIYEGDNDASPAYVTGLRQRDAGRECSDPTVPPASSSSSASDSDSDSDSSSAGRVYADTDRDSAPRTRSSSGGGRVGRDGDGDGWCNESTVPVPC